MTSMEWLAVLAVIAGGVTRLLKADKLNAVLERAGLRPIPKAWLPWIAIAVGVFASVVDALLHGASLPDALRAALLGVVAGSTAIAGQETVEPLVRAGAPRAAAVVFGGKKDGTPRP